MEHEYHEDPEVVGIDTKGAALPSLTHPFAKALSKIATADAASSRAAIEASKATKPSLHTRFFHDPAKDRA